MCTLEALHGSTFCEAPLAPGARRLGAAASPPGSQTRRDFLGDVNIQMVDRQQKSSLAAQQPLSQLYWVREISLGQLGPISHSQIRSMFFSFLVGMRKIIRGWRSLVPPPALGTALRDSESLPSAPSPQCPDMSPARAESQSGG